MSTKNGKPIVFLASQWAWGVGAIGPANSGIEEQGADHQRRVSTLHPFPAAFHPHYVASAVSSTEKLHPDAGSEPPWAT
jgi:hypothetical protein